MSVKLSFENPRDALFLLSVAVEVAFQLTATASRGTALALSDGNSISFTFAPWWVDCKNCGSINQAPAPKESWGGKHPKGWEVT